MNRKKLVVGLLAALLVLALAVGYAALPQVPGHIELSATQFDFGAVANTGPVSHTFQVHNIGQGPLEITGVATSCGCTSAAVAEDRLAPGTSTDLTVTYDPLVHDGATGEYMRLVYVRSDDPATPEASLTIHVNVVAP
jgi:hypothetical protein